MISSLQTRPKRTNTSLNTPMLEKESSKPKQRSLQPKPKLMLLNKPLLTEKCIKSQTIYWKMIHTLTTKLGTIMFHHLEPATCSLKINSLIMKLSPPEIKKMVIQPSLRSIPLIRNLLRNISNLRLEHSRLNGLSIKMMKPLSKPLLTILQKLRNGSLPQIQIGTGLAPNTWLRNSEIQFW